MATHTKEQDTIGTIGGGKVVVGDKSNSTPVDKINRDTAITQVITKDTSAGASAYVSSVVIKQFTNSFIEQPVSATELLKALKSGT